MEMTQEKLSAFVSLCFCSEANCSLQKKTQATEEFSKGKELLEIKIFDKKNWAKSWGNVSEKDLKIKMGETVQA